MARRRRYRRRKSKSWSRYHQTKREKVHATYGGLERDVQSIFFDIDNATLERILDDYQARYGYGARNYASRTFSKWRSGNVGMSGVVLERLIHVVPPHLSFEQKYKLIAQAASLKKDTIRVNLPISLTVEEAIQTLSSSVENALFNDLPSSLKSRLTWLTQDEDFLAAKELLKEAVRHEAIIASDYLRENISNASQLASQVGDDATIKAEFDIKLLSTNILVTLTSNTVNSQTNSIRRETNYMSENGGNNPKGSELAKPVDDPNNLLNEALQRMPENKAREVMGKAADEALRLQVKRRESEDDVGIVNEKLRQASRFSEDMRHAENSDFEFSQTHRSEQGDARITVSRKTEAKRSCFVATACFGDIDHPTVSSLRTFRDEKLMLHPSGRSFVAWYYRNGKLLASVVSKIPGARAAIRPVLTLIARVFVSTSKY